jgi:hypothetical protein
MLFQQCLELLGALAIVKRNLVFACAGFHFQTHPFGGMRHGAGEHLLGKARSSPQPGSR